MAGWVGVNEAAAAAGVHQVSVRVWARRGLIQARRLACGRGPWRIRLDADGLPANGPAGPAPSARPARVRRS